MLQCGIVLKSDSIWAPLKITLNKLFGQFINPTRAVPDLASPLGLLPLSNAKLLFQRPFTNGAALWSKRVPGKYSSILLSSPSPMLSFDSDVKPCVTILYVCKVEKRIPSSRGYVS